MKRWRAAVVALGLAGVVGIVCRPMLGSAAMSNLGMVTLGRAMVDSLCEGRDPHLAGPETWFGRALEVRATNPSAHYGLGRILYWQGEQELASAEWRKAGWSAYEFAVRGEHILARDGFDAAEWWYEQARGAGDDPREYWTRLAITASQVGLRGEAAFARARYAEAEAWFAQAAELAERSGERGLAAEMTVRAQLAQGEQARSEERYADAVAWYDRVLQADAGFWSTAWWLQYLALDALGETETARAKLSAATACDDGWLDESMRFDAWYTWAVWLHDTSSSAAAVEALQRALSLYPSEGVSQWHLVNLHSLIGGVQRSLGNYAEAVESLREAVQLDQNDPWLHIELGEALYELDPQDADKANGEFANALRLKPDTLSIWRRVLTFWIDAGHVKRALALTTLVQPHEVLTATAIIRWGDHSKNSGQLEHALAWYQLAAEVLPGMSSPALFLQYQMCDEQGDTECAAAKLAAAVEVDQGWLDPDQQFEAWYLWGTELFEEGRFAEAVMALNRAVAVHSTTAKARYYLSQAYHQLGMSQYAEGDVQAALQSLTEALHVNSRNLWAQVNYGKVLYLYDSGQADSSQHHFLLATRLSVDNANLWANLVNFWKSMGEAGLAQELCELASAEGVSGLSGRLCAAQ